MSDEKIRYSSADCTVTVMAGDILLASSNNALLMTEDEYLPRLYFPLEDVNMEALASSDRVTNCAHKGDAVYFHIKGGETAHQNIAWSYPEPVAEATDIKGMIAFFEERLEVERC